LIGSLWEPHFLQQELAINHLAQDSSKPDIARNDTQMTTQIFSANEIDKKSIIKHPRDMITDSLTI